MPQTPKPAKAASLAFNLKTNLLLAISALSGLEEQAEQIHTFIEDVNNENIPFGFTFEDIPGTPFVVSFNPKLNDEYHAILCRGVDVSDHVSSSVEEAAMKIVSETYTAYHTDDGDRRRDEARDAKMEAAA